MPCLCTMVMEGAGLSMEASVMRLSPLQIITTRDTCAASKLIIYNILCRNRILIFKDEELPLLGKEETKQMC